MKLIKILLIFIFLFLNCTVFSEEKNCSEFKKFSKKYIECNTKNLKEKTNKKVTEGKTKFENSGIKEKIKTFKDSNTLTDLIKN